MNVLDLEELGLVVLGVFVADDPDPILSKSLPVLLTVFAVEIKCCVLVNTSPIWSFDIFQPWD